MQDTWQRRWNRRERRPASSQAYWVLARPKVDISCSTRRFVSSGVHRVFVSPSCTKGIVGKHKSTDEDALLQNPSSPLSYFDTSHILLGRKIAEACSVHARFLPHVGLKAVSALSLGQTRTPAMPIPQLTRPGKPIDASMTGRHRGHGPRAHLNSL